MSETSFSEQKNEAGFSLIELLIVSVILIVILGITTAIFTGVQSSYNSRREQAARISDATAAMDLISRVVRNAGNNTSLTSLTLTGNYRLLVKGDWNPADGALNDPFENVEFLVTSNVLYMVDNSGSTAVTSELAQGISSINFQYFDASGNTTVTSTQMARVRITLTTVGSPSRTVTSDVAIRNKIQPMN